MLLKSLLVLAGIYVLLCAVLYFVQERLIFIPRQTEAHHQYDFAQPFEELSITTADGNKLHGILFQTTAPAQGLIFYLHGNAGNLENWGKLAPAYTELGYDVFIFDYRGFGKSEGRIFSEKQIFDDNQRAYDLLKTRYPEDKIIVLGYSIGSGFAAKLAATNMPKLLILQTPYYSLTDLMIRKFPAIPTFLLKYQFRTDKFLKECQMPIIIYHGTADKVIYYGAAKKLQNDYPNKVTLITLEGQGHNGITDNPEYRAHLRQVLAP